MHNPVSALTAITGFTIQGKWNDFFGPLIYLNSENKLTLALVFYILRFDKMRVVRSHAEEFELDAQRIGAIGFSAGGYVAAAVSTMHDPGDPEARDPIERASSRPDASVLFYPVTHLASSRFLGLLLANDPEPPPELARQYSPSLQVGCDTPPVYLDGLLTDQILAPDHLLDYAGACHRHGVPFELHRYGYGAQGAGMASADPRLDWQSSPTHWLGEQGVLAK